MFSADENTDGPRFRDGHHQLWLAMQTAHDEYSRASSVLGIRIADLSDSPQMDRDLVSAEHDYRIAFEAYIDARLRFAEFTQQSGLGQEIPGGRRRGHGAFVLLAAALFGMLSLGAIYSIPHRQELLQLKAERDQLEGNLRLARRDLDALSQRVEAVEGNQLSRQPNQSQQASEQRHFASRRIPRKLSSRQAPRKRNAPSRLDALRSHQEFTLPSSLHFSQVGPVRLSFRRLDVQEGTFDLFFIAGDDEIHGWRLKIYQPVRIRVGDAPGSVELVVNRISENQAHGYISIPRNSPSTVRLAGVRPLPHGR